MNENIKTFKELIIGSSLSAVIYSFVHSVPIIFKRRKKPAPFEIFEPELVAAAHPSLAALFDLSRSKREIWTKIIFALNTSGLVLTNNHTSSIRVDEEHREITITPLLGRAHRYKFERIYVFDDDVARGLPAPTQSCTLFKVLDWINVRACGPHDLKVMKTDDDFVKEVHFVSFRRAIRPENIVALSYLTPDQLKCFDFSDTMAKFKVLDLMIKNGIKGPRNGRNTQDPTKYKHYAIKIESSYRKIEKASMHHYEDSDALKFMYLTDEDVLTRFKAPVGTYQYKTYQAMNGKG